MRGCACRGTAGVAHVSCLVEQAKILVAETEENNLGWNAFNEKWQRWYKCSLCEQQYQGVVYCALGWACHKTYLGRSEREWIRISAITQLGNGLTAAEHHEEALTVREAELSMLRRLNTSQEDMLTAQDNLATSFFACGRHEESVRMKRDIYSSFARINGQENIRTLTAANNYAASLGYLGRFEEAKLALRETLPVARRVLGESHDLTLRMRKIYAHALYSNPRATLDDLREAVARLEEWAPTARRVLGAAHPNVRLVEESLRATRAALRARDTSV